jgi:hypothetical protein
VRLHGHSNLLEIVLALSAARRLASRLNRGKQQGHKQANDRDHDQNFDERKARTHRTNAHDQILSLKGDVGPPRWEVIAADTGRLIRGHLKPAAQLRSTQFAAILFSELTEAHARLRKSFQLTAKWRAE